MIKHMPEPPASVCQDWLILVASAGLSPQNDRIMEIAVKHVPQNPASESDLSPSYVHLVASEQRPNRGAYNVHKISHREATQHGKPFR